MAVLGSEQVRGIGLAGSRALIARIVAVFALLFCAVIALRGHIPGMPDGSGSAGNAPSALTVALMPVLLTVSVVVLLAGVIASQHRLPLALPDLDSDTESHWRLGRLGLAVLFLLALVGVLAAIVFAVYFIGFQRVAEPVPAAPPGSPAPQHPATPPGTQEDQPVLTGTGLFLATAAAGTLVAVAVTGLAVVTVNTQRRERAEEPDDGLPATGDPPTTDTDTLVKAAEMGLAAMNAAGQDPRAAIIACYLAMERGLVYARGLAPLASDTPMEVLARAFEHGALHEASARELVALFEEARFSPHSMLSWQRMRAEQLLRVALSDLQSTPDPAVSAAPDPGGYPPALPPHAGAPSGVLPR
ncbi:DUF4129 domain-containing protein [Nocardia rhamnosiphila]|uniref:DUF4129 domain-containing protein n=1 Tax=Nocardia rhamnosiphila TaxID=426716 RepID=UPI000A63F1F9|nr:DUF4129 domain-containing protein [Nocardia rhamnosiphila]